MKSINLFLILHANLLATINENTELSINIWKVVYRAHREQCYKIYFEGT